MSKVRDNDLILLETEMIQFPDGSKIIEDSTAGLTIIGTSTVDATNLKGVEVDIATLTDQGELTYDSDSGKIIFNFPLPPSGDTGLFGGGATLTNAISYFTISSSSDSASFGHLLTQRYSNSGHSNGLNNRGMFTAGYSYGNRKYVDYVTINSPGNGIDWGDLYTYRVNHADCSNNTNERGVIGGGSLTPAKDIIGYVTINTLGASAYFGDLTTSRGSLCSFSNGTAERGIFAGGSAAATMDYVTINSTSNAANFGNLLFAVSSLPGGTSNLNRERGIIGGGNGGIVDITYVTINTTGDAQDFGDLNTARYYCTAVSNGNNDRGVFAGLGNPMEYVTISTTGNATNIGNMVPLKNRLGACDNG